MTPLRCGDYVRHRPTGQELLIAWAEDGYASWFGWPPGQMRVDECDVLERCTDEEHAARVQQIVDSGTNDNENSLRPRVLRLYRPDLWSARQRAAVCIDLALQADQLAQHAVHFGDGAGEARKLAQDLRDFAQRHTTPASPAKDEPR